ncbi:MAG: hypothetical protein ACRC6M_03475, partial [Microcystaceae cyanobacterium]
ELWQALSVNALRCLGLPFQPKNYLLFDPQFNWSVEAANLQTQGENTVFLGKSIQGKVLNIFSVQEQIN